MDLTIPESHVIAAVKADVKQRYGWTPSRVVYEAPSWVASGPGGRRCVVDVRYGIMDIDLETSPSALSRREIVERIRAQRPRLPGFKPPRGARPGDLAYMVAYQDFVAANGGPYKPSEREIVEYRKRGKY